MNLTDKNDLIEYLKSNGLYAKHSLGQNFLVDRGSLEKIIDAAELKAEDFVIEVGPGTGALTLELVKNVGGVVAIEKDEQLASLLISNLKFLISNQFQITKLSNREADNIFDIKQLDIKNSIEIKNCKLKIVVDDILKVNIPELVGDRPYKVVANIPYYITSKILQLFLTLPQKPEVIVVLTQKEVAERVCAKAGQMSVLSVSVQVFGEPEIVSIVPKDAFFPSPKVDSAILRIANIHSFSCHSEPVRQAQGRLHEESSSNAALDPSAKPQDDKRGPRDDKEEVLDDGFCNEKAFFRLVKIGFSSRRKTLINNLSVGYHIDKKKAEDIIKSAGFGVNVRAQELSIDDWKRLLAKIMDYES